MLPLDDLPLCGQDPENSFCAAGSADPIRCFVVPEYKRAPRAALNMRWSRIAALREELWENNTGLSWVREKSWMRRFEGLKRPLCVR
jgi:hypothetical protein